MCCKSRSNTLTTIPYNLCSYHWTGVSAFLSTRWSLHGTTEDMNNSVVSQVDVWTCCPAASQWFLTGCWHSRDHFALINTVDIIWTATAVLIMHQSLELFVLCGHRKPGLQKKECLFQIETKEIYVHLHDTTLASIRSFSALNCMWHNLNTEYMRFIISQAGQRHWKYY